MDWKWEGQESENEGRVGRRGSWPGRPKPDHLSASNAHSAYWLPHKGSPTNTFWFIILIRRYQSTVRQTGQCFSGTDCKNMNKWRLRSVFLDEVRQEGKSRHPYGSLPWSSEFPRGIDTYLWYSSFSPRPTWYVPCGLAITNVPSPKVAQQLLFSQLVMTVA